MPNVIYIGTLFLHAYPRQCAEVKREREYPDSSFRRLRVDCTSRIIFSSREHLERSSRHDVSRISQLLTDLWRYACKGKFFSFSNEKLCKIEINTCRLQICIQFVYLLFQSSTQVSSSTRQAQLIVSYYIQSKIASPTVM